MHFVTAQHPCAAPGSLCCPPTTKQQLSWLLLLRVPHCSHCWRAGYRDDSLETVKRNEQQYQIPLEVVSYKQLYGWTMDEIVREIGKRNNCTFCGVFRRQALDRGAHMVQVSCRRAGS